MATILPAGAVSLSADSAGDLNGIQKFRVHVLSFVDGRDCHLEVCGQLIPMNVRRTT
jgi:hypothetical protein